MVTGLWYDVIKDGDNFNNNSAYGNIFTLTFYHFSTFLS